MIAKICCCLLALLVYVQYLLYLMHMFQLNTYKNNEQSAWNKKNSAILGRHIVYLAVTLAGYVFTRPAVGQAPQGLAFAAICLLLILQLWFWQPKQKAKKPLVYTARVIRMLVTHGILLLVGVPALVWVLPAYDVFTALIFYTMLLPWLILLVNRLNAPIQKAINRKFIKEAENKIKAMPELTVIGITGSYGKTSTKHYLNRILCEKYNVLMTPGSFNTPMGVVRTVRESMQPYHDIFIAEMGAKNIGDIKEICDIVNPSIGIVTAVGPQHLESFKSIENVQRTKFELVDALPADGLAVVNDDFEFVANRKVDNVDVIRYAVHNTNNASCRAVDIEYSSHGTSFTAVMPDGSSIKLQTKLVGECNISNLLAAVSVAAHLGVPAEKIRYAVSKIEQVEHRLNMKRTPGGVTIIDDAFNSNPDGARMALDVIAQMKQGKRIVITPGMIELGPRQAELNEIFGQQLANACDVAIVVGEYNREAILAGINKADCVGLKLIVADSFADAQAKLASIVAPGDTVLYENDLPDTFK